MDHIRLYLRTELRKLRNLGDARCFLARSECRPAPTAEAVVQMFATRRSVDEYVDSLDDAALNVLADCCSVWRRNGVADLLRGRHVRALIEVPISAILLRQAEPELRKAFERNLWRLDAIARDPEVLLGDAYRGHAAGDFVEFRTCLSDPPESGTYRLIDGMHRAIQMARNGEPTIPLGIVGS